jgi:hypothetical protein
VIADAGGRRNASGAAAAAQLDQDVREESLEPVRDLEAVHARHADVEQDDLRLELGRREERRRGIEGERIFLVRGALDVRSRW